MCMGYAKEIKAWVRERDQQQDNGMWDAWWQVLYALPDGAFCLPFAAPGVHDDLRESPVQLEGETR